MTIEATRGDITLETVDAIVNARQRVAPPGRRGLRRDLRRGRCRPRPRVRGDRNVRDRRRSGDAGVSAPGALDRAHGRPGVDTGVIDVRPRCCARAIEGRSRWPATQAPHRSLFPPSPPGLRLPPRAAAEIAVATVLEHAAELDLVRLVAFDESTLMTYRELLANVRASVLPRMALWQDLAVTQNDLGSIDHLLTTTRAVRKRLDLRGPCRARSCSIASGSRSRRRPAATRRVGGGSS